MCFFLLFFSFF